MAKIETPKILALIPSEAIRNNRRGAQRDTWIREAYTTVKAYFLVCGIATGDDENMDSLSINHQIFDGQHITIDIFTSIKYIKHLEPEWLLICDNFAYLWIARFLKYLNSTKSNLVGYESQAGNVYFIRCSAFSELCTEEHKTEDIVTLIRKDPKACIWLSNIAHPLRYPKVSNNYMAVLGQRPDKIIRIHSRRSNPHIAIITIALGKYDRFFGGWYEAIQEYFLPSCTRHYYVYTDTENLPYVDCEYCTIIKQRDLGWPGNTRDRFEMFLQQKDEICANFDYVFFLQVTARLTTVMEQRECIPTAQEDWMWVTRNIDLPTKLTYDPNPRSAAYIPKSIGRIYVQGGACGGRCQEFFQMCETCMMGIKHNRQNGVGEYLNDESHMNHYFLTKSPKEGWLRFWWPPTKEQAKKCKIFTLEKKRYGGFMALKGLR